MVTLAVVQLYNARTQRSGYSYELTPKHHGADRDAARWLPELTADEEFTVFDSADGHDISDKRGWLFGVLRANSDGLQTLGTWNQQVAEFPGADEGRAWHENRRGEKARPSKIVFQKMVQAGLLTVREKRILMKGDYA